MKARLGEPTQTMTGEIILPVITRDKAALALWDDLQGKAARVEIKQWRERRSLDANAYAWVLIDKLASVLRRDKAEIYREAIRGIGGVSDTVCVRDKAVESLVNGWRHNGAGWFAETTPSKIPGCTNVTLYYGSSVYDTRQMSALIEHIVQDCKAVGIETMTPAELAALEMGGERYAHKAATA